VPNFSEKKVNSQFMKELNELRILNLIRNEGPISRIEIAKRTKISKVSVSEIVARLDAAGYILETGKGESTIRGGKRPTLLKLNPENGYVIGVEIRRVKTVIAIADLESEIVDSVRIDYDAGVPINQVLPLIFQEINGLFKKHAIPLTKLVNIGIALPGFINYQEGNLIFADTLRGWDNRPLVSEFRRKYKIPIIIENDVNAMALGEYLLGAGQGYRNQVCIWIGEGIGAGIIVNDELIRGDYGSAGEIGYIEIGHHVAHREFFRELYTSQKYFGDILGEEHLLESLRTQLRSKLQLSLDQTGRLEIQDLLAGKYQQYDWFRAVLDEYALLLSILCTDLVKTINPSLMILNGKIFECSEYLFERIRQDVKQHMVNIPFEPAKMVTGQLQQQACIKGIVVMALQVIFEPLSQQKLNHISRDQN
jgi:predicted NBD/HSP70 family sugar kinase